uniref:Uncharacterized protein n=1 Tax=Populus trichocarpa TaxID=3694 RepID=A0A2K2BS20_POPTR
MYWSCQRFAGAVGGSASVVSGRRRWRRMRWSDRRLQLSLLLSPATAGAAAEMGEVVFGRPGKKGERRKGNGIWQGECGYGLWVATGSVFDWFFSGIFVATPHTCDKVYYTYPPGNKSSEWWTVIKTTARSRYNVDMGEFIEDANNVRSFDVDQSDEISQPCRVLPTQTLDDPNILVESSYYEEIGQHEMLQLDINWGNKDDDEEEDDGDRDGDGDGEEEEDEDEDDCYGGDGNNE